jgi:Tol biopolymer transport system component
VPELTRVSPDDGQFYSGPSISPNGQFVVYASDRGGHMDLWLQQIGGGNPIQLTHSAESVAGGQFFPDGTRILYVTRTYSSPSRWSIQTIPTLGGEPQVLASGGSSNWCTTDISPDGRSVVYGSLTPTGLDAFVIPASGGTPRKLTNWQRTFGVDKIPSDLTWTSDSRWLITAPMQSTGTSWEWFAMPVDGADPIATGAGAALRAAGLESAHPEAMRGNRLLFRGQKGEQENVWEIDLTPGSWRVAGAPRQLTFGTERTTAGPVSATGTAAVQVSKYAADLYLLPLDPRSGQASGTARRLTQDGRSKYPVPMSGEPGSVYFGVFRSGPDLIYALNLETSKQTLVSTGERTVSLAAVTSDGRQVAYSVRDGDAYSIRVGAPGIGAATARELCKRCGYAQAFSPDGRFVLYYRDAAANSDGPERKSTVRLLEVASGKDRPWLEHPTNSVAVYSFGGNGEWVSIVVKPLGSNIYKPYLVPWREEPVPVSDWIAVPTLGDNWSYAPAGNFLYFLRDSKLAGVRFDPKTRSFGQPFDVKMPPGPAAEWKPSSGGWQIAGAGLVFSRRESHSAVWLMKVPE